MSPMVIIRQARLSLFARLVAKRPECILELCRAFWDVDCGWFSALRSDLAWFPCSSFFSGSSCLDVPSLWGAVALSPAAFARSVRRFAATRFANFDVPTAIPSIAPPLFFNSYCTDCGKCFNTYQKLALHKKVKHGLRDPVNALVDDVFCPVCLLFFHDRIRLLNHLKYRSLICRMNLLAQGPLISSERADELDVECRVLRRSRYAAGLRAHTTVLPVFRLQGPLPLPVSYVHVSSNTHILGNGRRHYG